MKMYLYTRNSTKRWPVLLALLALLCLSPWLHSSAIAQQSISGTVTDDAGDGLPGVNVTVKGTTRGTTTNIEGKFTLALESGDETLVFSYIGYVPMEVAIGNQSSFSITLKEDITQLEGVVVIGYGQTQNEKEKITSITKIDSKVIESLPVYRSEQALQGTAPGVIVLQESGSPGAPLTIRIRGVSSAQNASPLYLVDGVQVPNLDFLNSADIKNITVLKDAASAAIYGARGGNGVILVQTKQGRRNMERPQISVSGYYGVQSLGSTPDLMDKDEFISYFNNSYDYYNTYTDGSTLPSRGKFTDADAAQLPNTNWYDVVFDDAPMQNYYASIADGGEDYSYALSAGAYRQDGMVGGSLDKSNFARNSIRASFEKDIYKGLNLSFNGTLVGTTRNFLTENNTGTGFAIMNYVNAIPAIYPTHAENGEIFNPGRQSTPPSINGVELPIVGAVANPLLAMELNNNRRTSTIRSFNVSGSYELGNVTVRSTYSHYGFDQFDKSFIPTYDYPVQTMTNPLATLTETPSSFWRNQWETTVTYEVPELNGHTIQALLGNSVITDGFSTESKAGQGFFVNSIDEANFALMQDQSQIIVSPQSTVENGWLSFFGRVNYDYLDKYMLGATLRADASSKFGPSNRTGIFPSLSAGWNMSEESFMAGVSALSLLKLRASWGLNGNDQIGSYNWQTQLSTAAQYVLGGSQTLGIAPTILANPDVKWEQVAQTNIGLDANLFDDRVGITAEYYIKNTTDMLAPTGTPILVGQAAPFKNVADVRNQGLEIMVSYKNQVNEDFKYNLQANFATQKNEVTSLGEGQPINSAIIQPSWSSPIARTDVGLPIASFWGYQVESLDESGNLVFRDLDGDGNISNADKTVIGNPYPSLVFGLTGGVNWKGFDLNFFLFGNQGNDIYKAYLRPDAVNVNKPAYYGDAWRDGNTSTDVARSNLFGLNNGQEFISDYYVENGSFMRLKNLSLGYTLPASLTKNSSLRLYITGTNLFTMTSYTGADPEIGQSSSNSFLDVGIDRGFYPQPRVVMGGFQFNFF